LGLWQVLHLCASFGQLAAADLVDGAIEAAAALRARVGGVHDGVAHEAADVAVPDCGLFVAVRYRTQPGTLPVAMRGRGRGRPVSPDGIVF